MPAPGDADKFPRHGECRRSKLLVLARCRESESTSLQVSHNATPGARAHTQTDMTAARREA